MSAGSSVAASVAIVAAALLIAACAGDGKGPAPPTRATRNQPTPPSPPVRAGEVEVIGIVSSVDAVAGTIVINRLSGANAQTIAVDGRTVMRRATGGSLTLDQIRPSDRIIATGVLDEATQSLLASQVEVGAVGDPGSGG